MKRVYFIIASLLAIGCAGTVPEAKDDAFEYAVEAVKNESHEKGMQAAWVFLDAADPDDPRYDRGLRLMARAAGIETPLVMGTNPASRGVSKPIPIWIKSTCGKIS